MKPRNFTCLSRPSLETNRMSLGFSLPSPTILSSEQGCCRTNPAKALIR